MLFVFSGVPWKAKIDAASMIMEEEASNLVLSVMQLIGSTRTMENELLICKKPYIPAPFLSDIISPESN